MEHANPTTIPEFYKAFVYMRRAQCACASGFSVAFFDRLAWKGEGPPFRKTGKRSPAMYPTGEFFVWLDAYLKGGSSNA